MAEQLRADKFAIYAADGRLLAHTANSGFSHAEQDANARRLVRCWNAHDDLVAACKAARNFGSQGDTHEGISVSWLLDEAIRKAQPEGTQP